MLFSINSPTLSRDIFSGQMNDRIATTKCTGWRDIFFSIPCGTRKRDSFVTFFLQPLKQRFADKARSSGDNDFHSLCLGVITRSSQTFRKLMSAGAGGVRFLVRDRYRAP